MSATDGVASRLAKWMAVIALTLSLTACGPHELPTDCTELAQSAQAHLSVGRAKDARRCAEKLLATCADARHSDTACWLLARCAIVESTDPLETIVELQKLMRGAGAGPSFEFSELARDEMAVLLGDADRPGADAVQGWLLEHALAGERRRCAQDAYVEELCERLRTLSPAHMWNLSTQCDFSSDF